MSDWTTVAATDALGRGDYRVVDVDGVQIAVFNLDDEYYAIEDVCTHDGAPLCGGAIDGSEIICPRHGARFCIKTGAALTPPAYEPVTTFPVRVEGGAVQVKDPRWD